MNIEVYKSHKKKPPKDGTMIVGFYESDTTSDFFLVISWNKNIEAWTAHVEFEWNEKKSVWDISKRKFNIINDPCVWYYLFTEFNKIKK